MSIILNLHEKTGVKLSAFRGQHFGLGESWNHIVMTG